MLYKMNKRRSSYLLGSESHSVIGGGRKGWSDFLDAFLLLGAVVLVGGPIPEFVS